MPRLNKKQPAFGQMSNWRLALARLDGAYSEATLRAYRADMEAFETWCQKTGRKVAPASPKTLADFVAYQAEICASSTIRRRLAAIRKVHRLLKFENPGSDEEVLIAMRRALRKKTSRPRQALGLTQNLRDRLIAACPDTPAGIRNRALIALGYDTLCRRSELIALRVEDIIDARGGSAQILIRRSKSDPFGNGRLGYISSETRELLNIWLSVANIKSGYIFSSVNSKTMGEQILHPFTVNRILKQTARRAKIPAEEIQRLSGHSMRVGAAQDMIVSGLDILPIMQAGGWKSVNVVSRYVENANLSPLLERVRATGTKTMQ